MSKLDTASRTNVNAFLNAIESEERRKEEALAAFHKREAERELLSKQWNTGKLILAILLIMGVVIAYLWFHHAR